MILVSACLAGLKTRYDGGSRPDENVIRLVRKGEAIPVCPEVLGGLPIPREAAAMCSGCGWDVLSGEARVLTVSGRDVTTEFRRGAELVLRLALSLGVRRAVLKSKSSSCGAGKREEDGVTAALLKKHGIDVLQEKDIQ